MLTSYGITKELRNSLANESIFYLMPPIDMRAINNAFMPDYAVLLLCDRVILGESSFAKLEEEPPWLYESYAKTLRYLYSEGFIELVDFDYILRKNETLLQRMLEHDLEILDQWIRPLKESVNIWYNFVEKAASSSAGLDILQGPGIRAFDRNEIVHITRYVNSDIMDYINSEDTLRERIRYYLSHINANIVLSNELGVGFHDWADFSPFYKQKFLSVGREGPEGKEHIEAIKNLFEVSFPEYNIKDPTTFTRILHDERITELRELVQDAVEGKIVFNEDFARNVFKEVFEIERRTSNYRKIISYLTMPVGFFPGIGTIAQKTTEEALGTLLGKKLKQKYRWFYMLSDIVEGTSRNK